MAEKVTTEDIEEYIENQYGESIDGLSDHRITHLPDDFLFEAFAERAIEQNPEYEITNLKKRWNEEHDETGISRYEFAVKVFDELIGEEIHNVMTTEQKDFWIEATSQGLLEVTINS